LSLPFQSATYVEEPASVIVVEALELSALNNAVVYDPDGSVRLRLSPPALRNIIGFDQVFVSGNDLVTVVATRGAQFQGDLDLRTGELSNVRDWR
jgi:hypothetical protein